MKIFSRRNDLIHGNFKPSQFCYDFVYFDGFIPIYKTSEGPVKDCFVNQLKFIEPDFVLNQLKEADDFQEFILGHIHESAKFHIHLALQNPELGWSEKKTRLGVLFPPHRAFIKFDDTKIFRDWKDDLSDIFL
jgi:hypothetical protein